MRDPRLRHYIYQANGPKTALGCGLLLLFLGVILLSPVIAILIDILGWTLVVLGLVAIAVAAYGWLTTPRRLR